jgi:hypothetical protein
VNDKKDPNTITLVLTAPTSCAAVGVSVYLERLPGRTILTLSYEQWGVRKTGEVDWERDLTAPERAAIEKALQPALAAACRRMGFGG